MFCEPLKQIITLMEAIFVLFINAIRELFIHMKAMVRYGQLSTYFRIGFRYKEIFFTVIKLSSQQLVDNYT